MSEEIRYIAHTSDHLTCSNDLLNSNLFFHYLLISLLLPPHKIYILKSKALCTWESVLNNVKNQSEVFGVLLHFTSLMTSVKQS